jgi:hypothetical protein
MGYGFLSDGDFLENTNQLATRHCVIDEMMIHFNVISSVTLPVSADAAAKDRVPLFWSLLSQSYQTFLLTRLLEVLLSKRLTGQIAAKSKFLNPCLSPQYKLLTRISNGFVRYESMEVPQVLTESQDFQVCRSELTNSKLFELCL